MASSQRSLFAPWLGGAGFVPVAVSIAARRSLFAVWLGGAGVVPAVVPIPTPARQGGHGQRIKPVRVVFWEAQQLQRQREEQERQQRLKPRRRVVDPAIVAAHAAQAREDAERVAREASARLEAMLAAQRMEWQDEEDLVVLVTNLLWQ